MVRNKRGQSALFENNENIGAYADISFDIVSETEMGPERLRFETKLHYVEKGEGEPLLLVHGIGQSLYTWRNNIDFFAAAGYRVIALDMVGFGYSQDLNIYYTVEENAMAIGAFLNALRIKKTHIIGFSTGALSALAFAASNPKRVGRMIIISPGGPNDNYPFALKFLTTRLGAFLFKHFFSESTVYNVLKDLYFDATQLTDNVVQGYYEPLRYGETRETLIRCMLHFDGETVRPKLKTIPHEILIFMGAQDRLHTAQIVKPYTIPLQHKRLVRIRNCAHFVHEEKSQRFNTAALEFLQEDSKQIQDVWPVVE